MAAETCFKPDHGGRVSLELKLRLSVKWVYLLHARTALIGSDVMPSSQPGMGGRHYLQTCAVVAVLTVNVGSKQ